MEEWEMRQKHHDDISAIHKKLGNLNKKGEILRFKGKTFFPEIEKLGHTTSVLETCKCWAGQISSSPQKFFSRCRN